MSGMFEIVCRRNAWSLAVVFHVLLLLAMTGSGCVSAGGSDPDTSDGDAERPPVLFPDGDAEDPADGDLDYDINLEGDPNAVFAFGPENASLSNWRVIDESGIVSDWTASANGWTQWGAGRADASAVPERSRLRNSELRYMRRPYTPRALEMRFTVGEEKGGVGFTLYDGTEEVLFCFSKARCGGSFVRWRWMDSTLAIKNAPELDPGETATLLVTVESEVATASVNGRLLLATEPVGAREGRFGLLEYAQPGLTVHEVKIWGVPGAEAEPSPRGWLAASVRGRGEADGRNLFPENSLAAVLQAGTDGVDLVGVDVRATSDGMPVLLHDATLDRTSDCSGAILDRDWERSKLCSVSDADDWPGEDELLPRLEDALLALPNRNWMIHLPPSGNTEFDRIATESSLAALENHGVLFTSWIVSEDADLLYDAHLFRGGARAALIANDGKDDAEVQTARLAQVVEKGFNGLVFPYAEITDELLAQAVSAGVAVFAGPLDGSDTLETLAAKNGITGLISNRPDRLAGLSW